MKQTAYIAHESIKNLGSILNDQAVRNVFLVTGENSFKLTGAQNKLASILDKYNVTHFYGFKENPRIEDVKKGISLLRKHACDLVVAVGGGSVIDMAKLIAILSKQKDNIENYIKGDKELVECALPLIGIPTTAGSGSEATHFAVVYIDKVKYSLANALMLPQYAIIDPVLTYSMSPRLTAVTGFDALSHAIESYWAVAATDESRKYAEEAIKIILENLKKAVHHPNPDVRYQMARAVYLAGKAINISKTTAPHAISYALTINYGVPHGHAVSLTLGKFFKINYSAANRNCNGNLNTNVIKDIMNNLFEIMDCNNPDDCDVLIKDLMEGTGLETRLNSLGLNNTTAIAHIIRSVNVERLRNNPVIITSDILYNVLKSIY